MPHTIEILENGAVYLKYKGVVTSKETKEADAQIYQNPEHPLKKVPLIIADFSKADEVDISYDQLEMAGIADREILRKNPSLRFAVIVGKELVFGLARIWQTFLREFETRARVFRSREEADAWLSDKNKFPS